MEEACPCLKDPPVSTGPVVLRNKSGVSQPRSWGRLNQELSHDALSPCLGIWDPRDRSGHSWEFAFSN